MTIAEDTSLLTNQEDTLRFTAFTAHDAWALRSAMREMAHLRSLALVMDIFFGIRPLFDAAMPGTTPENLDWVRRKLHSVDRFEMSSDRAELAHTISGKAFDETCGIDPMSYANAGGSFPLGLGACLVGAVTVSAIPQRDDHNFVAAHLAKHLKLDDTHLALQPEHA